MIQTSNIKELITDNIIKEIMEQYGAHLYSENNSVIIFPTICHNHSAEQASPKLYYYKNSKMFYCFTECSKSYDIFDLLVTIEHLRGNKQYTFFDALYYLSEKLNVHEGFFDEQKENVYQSKKDYYRKKNNNIPYHIYEKNTMNFFDFYLPYEWAKDGLTLEELKKYNVRYYSSENQVIIPHYSIYEDLVGIRIRALNEEDILKGKYRPLKLENIIYSHPLSQFCYGLWINKNNIQKTQKAIIFESEKSVILAEQLEYNNTVACCGSNISKVQIMQLVNCGAKEIVIAFDKEFTKENKKQEQYYNKLYKLAEKYKLYCNMSFIFDFNNILKEKQSPIDNNIEQFNYLLEKRIRL
jgi:hypothetical protein